MIPSRYFIIDERSPYPVKRRTRGRRNEEGAEPAITLLPPDPYLIMERPDFGRSPSPTVYRTAPPKSAKNKEVSSFVILGDTIRTPVQSRPGSPSGRVSPFRGHGFKSPSTTRPNSRAVSPSESPKRAQPSGRPGKPGRKTQGERPRIDRDIGLPPKSPSRVIAALPSGDAAAPTSGKATSGEDENKDSENTEEKGNEKEEKAEINPESESTETEGKTDSKIENEDKEVGVELEKIIGTLKEKKESEGVTKSVVSRPKNHSTAQQRLTPAQTREKSTKPPVSPKPKSKTEKNESNTLDRQSVVRKSTKPPLPPRKIGLKSTLQSEETGSEQGKKSPKEMAKNRVRDVREREKQTEKKQNAADKKPGGGAKTTRPSEKKKEEKSETKKEGEGGMEEKGDTKTGNSTEGISLGDAALVKKPVENGKDTKKVEGSSGAAEEKKSDGVEKPKEALIPCFQPDKCQIAPPTMASPSPTITPTISTPSTSADLSSSSMKNSQSIAAAPTSVTPSTLSSVSSTVVLTGNLARKEIQSRPKPREPGEVNIDLGKPDDGSAGVKESNGTALDCASADDQVSREMVKAASKDSIKWSNKENLSGEITKVIKAEPDMEVLSPNNLRDSPPRLQPPNLAWDDQRLPNGDVPNRAANEGKFRRFVSAVWRFFSYLFCCRCLKSSTCCRRSNRDEVPKPSRLNCCNGFKLMRNPFKCCCGNCKCGKGKCCESSKCCGKKAKTKPKPKSKSRKCCAKPSCSCKSCWDNLKTRCLNGREKLNKACRSLFCLNMMCCQKLLKKCKFCHKLKCCQQNGFCSCCNPYVKKETKKLHKKGSHASNHSRDKDQLDFVLVEHSSLMKAAIPVLPICLAVFCLICNLLVPGFGTLISGILCLCFGKPRFSAKDSPKNRMGSFIVNTIIAVAQLFTVVFCLVGWGWSIWWGVIMYKLSRRQKRIRMAEKSQKEAEGQNVNHNHVDVEQG